MEPIYCFNGFIQQCIKSDFKHGVAVQESNRQLKHAVCQCCQMEGIKTSQRL